MGPLKLSLQYQPGKALNQTMIGDEHKVERASNTISSNPEILEIELDVTFKRVIERAAGSQGVSIEDFIINSAYEAALKILDSNEVVFLDDTSWGKLQDLLDSPPMPTAALRKLMRS